MPKSKQAKLTPFECFEEVSKRVVSVSKHELGKPGLQQKKVRVGHKVEGPK